MPVDLWLAFVIASAVLLAIPGPTIMLVVSYALGGGRRTAWATVPGVVLGDAVAMTLSLLGAGAVLAASATLFTALKLCGAAYLVWLGIQLWRADPRPATEPADDARSAGGRPAPGRRGALFRNAFVVTALNPKGIVFFIAFVPQFVTPGHDPVPQLALLEATFLALAAANAAAWALLAGTMRDRLRRPSALRWINRIGGSVLVGTGAATAAVRHGG